MEDVKISELVGQLRVAVGIWPFLEVHPIGQMACLDGISTVHWNQFQGCVETGRLLPLYRDFKFIFCIEMNTAFEYNVEDIDWNSGTSYWTETD